MISGKLIHQMVANHLIKIDPYNPAQMQPHSYDLRLGDNLIRSKSNISWAGIPVIDTHRPGEGIVMEKESCGGFLLLPGKLYLGHTIETVGTNIFAPKIDSRSTAARFGVPMHLCAGFCDAGWYGQIVLEIINCNEFPVLIYPGDRVCQIYFDRIEGDLDLYKSTYQDQRGVRMAKSLED